MAEHGGGGFGLSEWWGDPDWLKMKSLHKEALYVLTKLDQRDHARFTSVILGMFGPRDVEPENLSSPQWQDLLTGMGATVAETLEVFRRLDRTLPDLCPLVPLDLRPPMRSAVRCGIPVFHDGRHHLCHKKLGHHDALHACRCGWAWP